MSDCISPRTGIKSSVPLYAQVIVTAYILWKESGKPYQLSYGEEFQEDKEGVSKLKFTNDELKKIKKYVSECELDTEVLQANTLVTTQIEPLQTAGKNFYKACDFSIDEGSEREDGVRRKKTITFTHAIDLFDAFVAQSEVEFKEFACIVLNTH